MNPTLVMALIATPAMLFAVALYWVDRVRRREALFRWSAVNGFKLLAYRQPLVTEASGFPISASKSQHVFHVDVEMPDGVHRAGWVRLGSARLGLASPKVDVRWEARS